MQDERDRRIAKLEQEVADLRTMVTALLADNQRLREENAQLRTEVEDLRARLGQNSSNSSKPPSTDSPADREGRRDKPPSGKKRGGQPGHKGSQRQLLTPTKPPVDCFPKACRRCDKHLPHRPDPDPIRHQTVDVPAIVPTVSEWRLHRLSRAATAARSPVERCRPECRAACASPGWWLSSACSPATTT